jgi:hypothetical protein
MLITYFKNSRTLARYRSGLANLYLESFIVWLESQGYRRFTIRRHVREVAHFADWAEAEGLALRASVGVQRMEADAPAVRWISRSTDTASLFSSCWTI